MAFRPPSFKTSLSMRRGSRYKPSLFMYGPQIMNISQPLSRATSVAETQSSQVTQKRSLGMYRFPQIPRPKRNMLYYSSWTRNKTLGLPRIPISKRSFSTANQKIKNKTKNFHRRFFSAEARKRRQERRRFVRWWTLTSLTVVIGGVAAKIRYDHHQGEDEEDSFNQYKIKPQSWQLYAYSTLPLKTISRLWGQFNSITLPVWMRSPSFKFYSAVFGVNLDEMEQPDLTAYSNLSEFFYRRIKPEVRPIADGDLVSPSDGKVLKFGIIDNGEIEQVKGMTYSIDALLGLSRTKLAAPRHSLEFDHDLDEKTVMQRDEEFAKINGISYSVDDLVGGESANTYHMNELQYKDKGDKTADKSSISHELSVARNLMPTSVETFNLSGQKQLFFAVIYLAPGDYHRYHSPTNWVTTLRRHFIGELFSVAPFFQQTLKGLFVLNERVALLGYWKHGFFSMIPVGATNVGSIVVNFDKDLKTNDRYEHEVYLRQQMDQESSVGETTPLLSRTNTDVSTTTTASTASGKPKRNKKNTVYEATYTNASRLLGGYPLVKGEEVGGFKLGSTVVLVFEAPENFQFDLELGQKIKMGQSLGHFNV